MRLKLRNLLRRQSRELLDAIVRQRELEIENQEDLSRTELVDAINNELRKDDQVKMLLNGLTPIHRALFDLVALYGGVAPEKHIVNALFQDDYSLFRETMDSLSTLALCFTAEASGQKKAWTCCYIPEQFLKFILVPRFAVKRLDHLLAQCSIGQLKSMAFDGLRLPPRQCDEEELLELIHGRLLNAEELKEHLENLSYPKKIFLKMLIDAGGECDVEVLRAQFAKIEGLDLRQFDEVLDEMLWREHFLFLEDVGHRSLKRKEHSRIVAIPIEVYSIIRSGFQDIDLTPTGLFRFLATRRIKDPRLNSVEFNVVRDVTTFLCFIATTEPQVLKKGGLRKNTFEHVCSLMPDGLPKEYVEFLITYSEHTRLIIDRDGFWTVDSEAAEFLTDPWKVFSSVLGFWSNHPRWMSYTDSAGKSEEDSSITAGNTGKKSFLADLLYFCPHDEPFDIDDYFVLLFDKASLLPNAVTSSNAMYNSFANGLSRLSEEEMRGVFDGVMTWLNMVERGKSENDREAVKLTPLGCALLSYGPIPAGFAERYQSSNRISFTPEGELEAFERLAPEQFLFLARFARFRREDKSFFFTVDKETLRHGFERGLSARDILKFLDEQVQGSAPSEVIDLIKESDNRLTEIVLQPTAGYLQVHDPGVLDDIVSHSNLRELLLEDRFDDKMILKHGISLEHMADELRRRGFPVRPTQAHQVEVQDDGRVSLSLDHEEAEFLLNVVHLVRSLSRNISIETDGEATFDNVMAQVEDIAGPLKGAGFHSFYDQFLSQFSNYIEGVRNGRSNGTDSVPVPPPVTYTDEYEEGEPHLAEVYVGPNPAEQGPHILSLLKYAAREKLKTRIYYALSEEQDNMLIDTVLPNKLEEENLIAICGHQQEERPFVLRRITRAEILNQL